MVGVNAVCQFVVFISFSVDRVRTDGLRLFFLSTKNPLILMVKAGKPIKANKYES